MTIQIKKISNSESTSGIETPESGAYTLNDSADTQETREFFASRINELIDRVGDLNNKIREQEGELKNQSSRNIEIIGVFSAILALLIIDVSIIKSVSNFLAAILLIVGLTCSLAIFAILIHSFFGPKENKGVGPHFWIPAGILILLMLIGLVSYGWENKFNITISSEQKQNQPQTNTVDASVSTNP